MTWLMTHPIAENTLTVCLYAAYMLTSLHLCSYSNWCARGAPNPFLPRTVKYKLRAYAKRQMSNGRLPVFA